jgi:ABC-type antimicrobial peptide transport system permease subunit
MRPKTIAMVFAVAAIFVGFGGWIAGGPLIFGMAGFLALLVALVLYAFSGSGEPRTAADLRRADQHEEHHFSEGPAPPGPP